jgi:hypothetical protein
LSEKEIRGLSMSRLSGEARVALAETKYGSRATLQDHLESLERQIGEAFKIVNGPDAGSREYERLGYLRATHRMTLVALNDSEASELSTNICCHKPTCGLSGGSARQGRTLRK